MRIQGVDVATDLHAAHGVLLHVLAKGMLGLAIGGQARAGAGVGPVDEAVARCFQHSAGQGVAHADDGAVVHAVVRAFPGGGVQHREHAGGGGVKGVGHRGNVFYLWAPYGQVTRQVFFNEVVLVFVQRGGARNEHIVVGLGLVAEGAELFALAVVDVNVQGTAVDEGLKVTVGVVDVQDALEGVELVQVQQVLNGFAIHGLERRVLRRPMEGGGPAAHQRDGPLRALQRLQRGCPLLQLVQLVFGAGKVHRHGVGHVLGTATRAIHNTRSGRHKQAASLAPRISPKPNGVPQQLAEFAHASTRDVGFGA